MILLFSPQARKDLKALDPPLRRRVLAALKTLQQTPRKGRELTGVKVGKWRLRVGDYRVRYDLKSSKVIAIYRIRHRKEIYRR